MNLGHFHLENVDICKEKIRLKKVLSCLPQEFGFYSKARAYDLLDHFAILKGMKDGKNRKQVVDYLINKVNLWDVGYQKLGTYSGGMKQRFGIAQALLDKPELIIVDEPTAGLDPAERKKIKSIIFLQLVAREVRNE